MKKIKFGMIALLFSTVLVSCGGSSTDQGKEGFSQLGSEIESKFGKDAYFTDLSVIYSESIGNSVNITVTEDPASLKMGEWNLVQGNWSQISEVTIEIPDGTKATDYMFQLGGEISLEELGELVEKSKKQLKEEKDIANATLSIASVIYPDNGDISKAQYSINLQPENGGTTFSFYYTLDGELDKMDY